MVAMARYVRGHQLPYLKAWRLKRFIAQAELAQQSGVSKSTITRAERGDEVVGFANIRKLADALDITPEELLNHQPDEQAKKR